MQKPLLFGGAFLLAAMTSAPAAQTEADPADVARGKAQYARCQACHSIDPAVDRGIGPNLAGIVNSPAGQQEGFPYSEGLAKAEFRWDAEKLDAFLKKPSAVVPGTTMVFAGMPNAKAREALIAYLSQQEK